MDTNNDHRRQLGKALTYRDAAILLGCHVSNVPKLIRKGQLTSNGAHGPGARSLSRAEVEALAECRATNRLRTPRRGLGRTNGDRRPDAEHDWLSVPQVAELLGVSRPAVASRIKRERLPATQSGGRHWVRADHLELVERARLASRTRRP